MLQRLRQVTQGCHPMVEHAQRDGQKVRCVGERHRGLSAFLGDGFLEQGFRFAHQRVSAPYGTCSDVL